MSRCPQCQHENPPGARFCNGCGARTELACAGCGQINPPGSRFCNGCGARLGDAAPAGPELRFASPEAYTPKHLAEKILRPQHHHLRRDGTPGVRGGHPAEPERGGCGDPRPSDPLAAGSGRHRGDGPENGQGTDRARGDPYRRSRGLGRRGRGRGGLRSPRRADSARDGARHPRAVFGALGRRVPSQCRSDRCRRRAVGCVLAGC